MTPSAILDRPNVVVPEARLRWSADRVAWGCLAVAAAGLLAGLARYWGANPAYADRLLVLVGAAWAASLSPTPAGRPRPTIGFLLVLLGAGLLPAAWYLQSRVGERTLLLWWQAAGLMSAAAGLMLGRYGWPRLRAFAFPLVFPLFALPIPDTLLRPLQAHLQGVTSAIAAGALPAIGVPVERSGFVLRLPGGDLGVAEACSGVRSLTALTATAAFVAYLRGFGPVRGMALVLLAVPLVAGVNALRVIATGLVQESIGPHYIQGWYHEGLGLVALFVGLAGVLGLARLLGPPVDDVAADPDPLRPAPPTNWAGVASAVVLIATVMAGVVAAATGLSAATQATAAAPLDDLPFALGDWRGEAGPVPDAVAEILVFDKAVCRVYENNLGRQAHAWVMFWDAAGAIKGYHHPSICWPNRGFVSTHRRREPVRVPGGAVVAAEAQDFAHGPDHQVVVSWTQEGRRLWTDDDEARVEGNFSVVKFLLPKSGAAEPRLTVLVATPSGGPGATADALELAGLLAAEVYRLCPWAAPAATTATPPEAN